MLHRSSGTQATLSISNGQSCTVHARIGTRLYSSSPCDLPNIKRRSLIASLSLTWTLLNSKRSTAVEQGIKPSDYTVPALTSAEYVAKIRSSRSEAWRLMEGFVEDSKYMELSNSLVLGPIDDIRQSVLYIPAALLKEGKRTEAIGSRKAYTDYMRELKNLDALAQKANRFDADEEDVKDSLQRLSNRLDDVLQYVQ